MTRVRARSGVSAGVRLAALAGVSAVAAAWGCSSSTKGLSQPAAGAEGGPCPTNRSCDVDLVCKDGRCVKPDASGGSSGGAAGRGGSTGMGGASGAGAGGSGAAGKGGGSGGAAGAAGTGGSGGSGGSGGTGGTGGTGGKAGAGGGGTGGMSAPDASADGPVSCNGTHPLIDGGRYCKAGECRCEATDACFPRSVIAACCKGNFQCFDADGGFQCMGTHPLIDGGRYCAKGVCYCPTSDSCFSPEIATSCCAVAPTCTK